MLVPEWGSLERAIEGEVGLPGSPTYHALARPFNARFHDVEPKAVVSCAIPQDVTEVIGFVLRHGEDLAVRAGGHSFGGHSATRGVLIDVTPMRTVTVSNGPRHGRGRREPRRGVRGAAGAGSDHPRGGPARRSACRA